MSFAQFSPDFDVYESQSVGDAFDTNAITGDMTALISRVGTGQPQPAVEQKIQHSDTLESIDFEDHPATVTFNGNSAVVVLERSVTKRYLRIVESTGPADDPLFVAGGWLLW